MFAAASNKAITPSLEMTVSQPPLFFTSRSRHTICGRDWSSDVCSSDLNAFHAPPGTYFPAVDEGYYVMLTPLAVGEHRLRIREENPSINLVLDVTYHLTVVPLTLP